MPERGFLSRLLSAPIEKTRLGKWLRDSTNSLFSEREADAHTDDDELPHLDDHPGLHPFDEPSHGPESHINTTPPITPTTLDGYIKDTLRILNLDSVVDTVGNNAAEIETSEVNDIESTILPIHTTVRSQGTESHLKITSTNAHSYTPRAANTNAPTRQHRTSHYTSSSSALMRDRKQPQQRRRTMSHIRYTRG